MEKKISERQFSVELNSNDHIRLESFSCSGVSIQGSLGKLMKMDFIEGILLEITGSYGSLTVDLQIDELNELLRKKRR